MTMPTSLHYSPCTHWPGVPARGVELGNGVVNFPWADTCRATPGLFLDTPLHVGNTCRFQPIQMALPDQVYTDVKICVYRLEVYFPDGAEKLYAGLKLEEVRTPHYVLTGVKAGVTFWDEPFSSVPVAQELRNDAFLASVKEQLIDIALGSRCRGDLYLNARVQRDSRFDANNLARGERTRTCWVDPGGSFFRLMGLLRSTLHAMLQAGTVSGVPRPINYHLRFWGCKWCGRAPTNHPLMGFWSRHGGDEGMLCDRSVFLIPMDGDHRYSDASHAVITDPLLMAPVRARFGRIVDNPPFVPTGPIRLPDGRCV